MQTRSSIRPCRFGKKRWRLLLGMALALLPSSLWADGADGADNGFYQQSKHGWFWYADPPPPEETKKQVPDSRPIPSLESYSVDDLWNMHPDDFQAFLDVLQKKAVQKPTEQNIMEYLTMQDIARRKALAYTNATMYVTQKYGELFNVGHIYPSATPGVTARVKMQQDEIFTTLSRAGNDHALLFFTSPGCGFCDQQAAILAYFVEKYGWPIKTVDISRNRGSAARFSITITPTLLLIKKGRDNSMTVANGVVALTELERKLYRAVRTLQGSTKEDTFLMYDFQKGSPFDPTSILHKGEQPWKITE